MLVFQENITLSLAESTASKNCSFSVVNTCTALTASWVSLVFVGRRSSWEERALWLLPLMFGVYMWECPSPGFVLCESVSAFFHTSPPLLSFWQNYLKSVGLSRIRHLHHGCASHSPAENLCTLIALYVAFTFCVSTTPSFHFVSKNVLGTELGEDLNDTIYLKSDRGTQLVLWP